MLTLNDGRSELWQWDTGRTLDVDADCSQIHFSNKVFGRSIDVDVIDGTAIVPDILLQTDKDLNVWAFVGTAENGYTKISKTFKVNRRNKPADYVFTPTDQTSIEEIKEKIERLESIQDPDAIKNAVEEYLEQNPVEAPVQSVNGKTGKVELTSEDVGAISKDDLQEATNEALAKAKANGEFDGKDGVAGKDGYTPVKGVDYWTSADQENIVQQVIAALGTPVFGAVDADNNIILTGELAEGTYTLKYENADGTVTEIGTFTVGASGPAYTNLFDPAAATLNQRWSNSSYGFSDTNGYVVSDFIPVSVSSDASNPTVLRFRGGTMAGKASIIYYNSSKALLADPNASSVGADCSASRMEVTTDGNGDYQTNLGYKDGAFVSTWANAGYIRVCLEINATTTAITANDIQNVIITIAEPIVD